MPHTLQEIHLLFLPNSRYTQISRVSYIFNCPYLAKNYSFLFISPLTASVVYLRHLINNIFPIVCKFIYINPRLYFKEKCK